MRSTTATSIRLTDIEAVDARERDKGTQLSGQAGYTYTFPKQVLFYALTDMYFENDSSLIHILFQNHNGRNTNCDM